jgi:hypothetical protein
MSAEVKRIKEIGDAQRTFNNLEKVFAKENGNRKYGYGYGYGYGEPRYIGRDGNYHQFPKGSRLKNSEPKPKRRRRIGPSVEQVAVARGIINIKTINVTQGVSP